MAVTSRLVVELDASGVATGVRQIKGGLAEVDRAAASTGTAFGGVVSKIGGMVAAFATIESGARLMKAVARETVEFDKALRGLSSITGITGAELEAIGDASDRLSRTYGVAAGEVLGMAKQLASLKPELAANTDGLTAMTESAMLLSKAQTDLTTSMSAEALAGALNAFNLGVEEAVRVTDILAEASRLGAREVPFLAEGLSNVGGVAASAGESIETTSAALETLGKTMRGGGEAGVALRNVITTLVQEAGKQGKEYQGLAAELDRLAKANVNLTDATALFGRENANAALQLIKNREELGKMTDALSGSAGAAMKQAEVNMGSVSDAVARLSAAWSGLLRTMGDSQAFKSVVDYLTKVANAANFAAEQIEGKWGTEIETTVRRLERLIKLQKENGDALFGMDAPGLAQMLGISEDAPEFIGLLKLQGEYETLAEKVAALASARNQLKMEEYALQIEREAEETKALQAELDALSDATEDAGQAATQLNEKMRNTWVQMHNGTEAIEDTGLGVMDLVLALNLAKTGAQHLGVAVGDGGLAQALRESNDELAALNEQAARYSQLARDAMVDVGLAFFADLSQGGEEAWANMLDNWEDQAVRFFEGRMRELMNDFSQLGRGTGSTGGNIMGGMGAGYMMGNAAGGAMGQGTGGAMLTGAAGGALAGWSVGGPYGAIAGAIIGAFTAGQGGKWEEIGRTLRLQIDDGLIGGFMSVRERKYSFGSSSTRTVMDELGPSQSAALQGIWDNFLNAFVAAGETLDLGDLGGRVSSFISKLFNIDISGMSPDEVLAAANREFVELGSIVAGSVMPSITVMRQEGETLAEAFIRVGRAMASATSFAEATHIDWGALVSDEFTAGLVDAFAGLQLQGLKDQLADLMEGLTLEDIKSGTFAEEIAELKEQIENFALTEEELASIQADAVAAWVAELETAMGGFDAMSETFGIVIATFYDTTVIAQERLAAAVESASTTFEEALLELGDLGTGIDRSNFADFLEQALSGGMGALSPESMAAILEAARALAELMNLEQQYADALGEAIDITSLTVDQINALNEAGDEWQQTLNALDGGMAMAIGGMAEFVAGVASLVGGLDAANAAFNQLVEMFFTDAQQFELLSQRLSEAAAGVGLSLDDIDTPEEIRQLMRQAMDTGNDALMAFLMQFAQTIYDFQQGLGGLEGAAGGATNAIDATAQALADSIQYWHGVGQAIGSALASVQSAIASIQSQQYQTLGPGATGPGSIGDAIANLEGQMGQGSIEDQINTITQLQTLLMQQYQMQMQELQSQGDSYTQHVSNNTQEQIAAAKAAHEAAMAYWERMTNVATSLKAFLKDLLYSDMAQLTPEQQLQMAQLEFEELLARALAGDAEAAEALQGAAQRLLDLARNQYASGAEFDAIFNMVVSGLQSVVDMVDAMPDIPPWVDPISQGLMGVAGAVTAGAGQNTEAIRALQDATIEQLEALEAELQRLQGIAEQEEQAAQQRYQDYLNNTEQGIAEIAANTEQLVGQGENVYKTAPDWGSLLENSWNTVAVLEYINDTASSIDGKLDSLGGDEVPVLLTDLGAKVDAMTTAIVDGLAALQATVSTTLDIDSADIGQAVGDAISDGLDDLNANISNMIEMMAQ